MDEAAEFRIYLLGPPHVEHRGTQQRVDTRKAIALLAWLAVERRSHARATLAALLWPESDEQHARGALRRTLYALSAILPEGALVTAQDRIELVDSPGLFIDVIRFRNAYREFGDGDIPCEQCAGTLAEAIELYRDTFLSGFSVKGSVEFDDWHFFQSEALGREYAALSRAYIRCLRKSGDLDRAVKVALRWSRIDPLDEEPQLALMELSALNGERASALRLYEAFRTQLDRELGEEPSEALVSLYDKIKTGKITPEHPHPQPLARAQDRSVRPIPDRHPATLLALRVVGTELDEEAVGRYMSRLYGLVLRYGGRIESHAGRNVLIIFGRSATRENAPELAVRAAVDARAAANRMQLTVAAGICSGIVDLAAGDGEQMESNVVRGAAVTDAQRLAATAGEGEVIVSEATYRSTRSAVRYAHRPGVERNDQAWMVETLRAHTAKSRGLEGLRSPLVGRDGELRRLTDAVDSVRAGVPMLTCVTGVAGLGKSRLIAEALPSTPSAGTAPIVLKGRCLDSGVVTGYWPFLDILGQYMSWTPEMSREQRQARVTGSLDDLHRDNAISDEQRAEITRGLSHLLRTSSPDDETERDETDDPYAVRTAVFRALSQFLGALARVHPLIVVLEDLHWADSLSIDLISYIMEMLGRDDFGEIPFGVICSYRPEIGNRCRHLPDTARRKCPHIFAEISLRELDEQGSIRLARNLLGDLAIPKSIEGFLFERARGNPFFIEEIVRSLLDQGILVKRADRWETTGEAPASIVPRNVESVIRAGTDRLSSEVQRVLRSAAVLGRVFDESIVRGVAAAEFAFDVDSALVQLEDLHLIYEERTLPRREYSFRHVLTREAVYSGIPDPQKKAMHRRAAEELEREFGKLPELYLEQVAHHCESAGLEQEAVRYLLEAGRNAIRSSHNDAAITHLERALRLIRSRPESAERDRLELEVLVSLGVPVTATTGYGSPDSKKIYERAHTLVSDDDRSPLAFAALFGLFRYRVVRGQVRVGLDLAHRLVEHASFAGDDAASLESRRALGTALIHAGNLVEGDGVLREGLALYDPERHRANAFLYGHDPATTFHTYIALESWLRGLPETALRIQEELVTNLNEVTHPLSITYALSIGVIVFKLAGQVDRVLDLTSRAIDLANEGTLPMFGAFGKTLRGWAIARTGNRTEGVEEMRRGLEELDPAGSIANRAELRTTLAEHLLEDGKVEEADRQLDAAEFDISGGDLMYAPEVFRVRAQVAARCGEIERARKEIDRAAGTARSTGALSLELRAAITSARLDGVLDRAECFDWLRATCERFTEGFDTADLRTAVALLAGTETRT